MNKHDEKKYVSNTYQTQNLLVIHTKHKICQLYIPNVIHTKHKILQNRSVKKYPNSYSLLVDDSLMFVKCTSLNILWDKLLFGQLLVQYHCTFFFYSKSNPLFPFPVLLRLLKFAKYMYIICLGKKDEVSVVVSSPLSKTVNIFISVYKSSYY